MCLHVCSCICVCGCPGEPEEDIRTPGAGVAGGCKPLGTGHRCWNQIQTLQEQQSCLPTETPLLPLAWLFETESHSVAQVGLEPHYANPDPPTSPPEYWDYSCELLLPLLNYFYEIKPTYLFLVLWASYMLLIPYPCLEL